MRLYCFECGKSVSNEVPDDTIVRATLICPECLELANKEALEVTLNSIKEALAEQQEMKRWQQKQ